MVLISEILAPPSLAAGGMFEEQIVDEVVRSYIASGIMQLYVLAVATNLVAGLILVSDRLAARYTALMPVQVLLKRHSIRVGIGAVAVLVGFSKLFFRVSRPLIGDSLLGDLAPALVSIMLGGLLVGVGLLQCDDKTMDSSAPASVDGLIWVFQSVLVFRVPIGITGITVAALHFLLPGVVLL